MKETVKSVLLTLAISFLVLYIFFGDLFANLNNTYFTASGDGLKSYAGAIYHLKHDTTLFRMNAMNYPYGEMIFYTDCQPIVVNQIKILAGLGIDFSDNVVGIINFLMLVSIVLAALFLCLIFVDLKVNWWFSAVAAVGITMLSPQIGRLGGHFSLSHILWLPALIWLLLHFHRNKSVLFSVAIGVVTFLAAGMHMYFFALFGFLFIFYWVYVVSTGEFKIKDYRWVVHILIQLVIPLILVQFIASVNDTITDRTTHPWGFTTYRANPASVFLPLHKPYARFIMNVEAFRKYDWEAFSYIGLVALAGFLAGIFQVFKRLKEKKSWWMVTDNHLLTLFFWASVASLLLSFSIPFNLGLMFLLEYLGPIQQLRALARFAWLFYYVVNILVFYGMYKMWSKGILMKAITLGALAFLLYDGYLNVSVYAPKLNNRVPELEAANANIAENEWVTKINANDYQAVMPLPYFHVGSENVWRDAKCDILKQSFIVSLKTGLPGMGVMLSRTSLSQTYKSLALVCKPVSPFAIINDLPNRKPLLLLADKCGELTAEEKQLIALAKVVWEGPKFTFYSLSVDALEQLSKVGEESFIREMKPYYEGVIDSSKVAYYNGHEGTATEGAFHGQGALSGNMATWTRVVEEKVNNLTPGDTCEVLFWVKGYHTDLFARSIVEFVQKSGDETVVYKYNQFQQHYVSLKDNWMRIRIPFVLKSAGDLIMVTVKNSDLKNFQLNIDDVIIRKATL